LLVTMMLLLASYCSAQDQESRNDETEMSYFGAPVVKWTVIRDQSAVMIGGRGGWNITSSILVGGGLYGTIKNVDAPEGAVPDAPGRLDIKLETFGFDVEYAVRPTAPTHMTLGMFLGGGADHYVQHDTGQQFGETDFILFVEPGIGVDHRLTDGVHLNLAVSYRMVSGVDQPGLENSDFNGMAVALAVKLGRF